MIDQIIEALKKLPPLYATEKDDDPVAKVKLFVPWGAATWYLWEYDSSDKLAFGYCDLGLGFPEVGYLSLDELLALRGPGGLQVEQDLHFDSAPLSQLRGA